MGVGVFVGRVTTVGVTVVVGIVTVGVCVASVGVGVWVTSASKVGPKLAVHHQF